MKDFNGNLNVYYALNAQIDAHNMIIMQRMTQSSTKEQMEAILQEGLEYIKGLEEFCKELGEEMVNL